LHVYREAARRIQERIETLEEAADEHSDVEQLLDKYDSVEYNFNDAKRMTRADIRGWEGLLTHGEDMYEQVTGTAASNDDVKSRIIDPGFDILYCGHFHESRWVEVMGNHVFRSGTMKPTDDWAKSVANGGTQEDMQKSYAIVHGVTDSKPVTWTYPIYKP